MNILIVENSETNRFLLEKTAVFLGFSADCAKDGGEALRCRMKKQYDLILLSLTLPDFDSYSTAQALRQLERSEAGTAAALICGLSRNCDIQVCKEGMNNGMNCCVVTPTTTGQAIDLLVKMRTDMVKPRSGRPIKKAEIPANRYPDIHLCNASSC